MDNFYLQELINETAERDGGLLLSFNDKPAVVVLSIEKYNQLISNSHPPAGGPIPNAAADSKEESLIPDADFLKMNHNPKKILVTGGAGYIGGHLSKLLLDSGFEVTILDDLSSGKRENVPQGAGFIEGSLADINLLRDLFAASDFYAVAHMAASVEVEESVSNPQKYFDNNALNTARLLSVMAEANVKNIIFSSTAAVYGQQEKMPITEKSVPRPNNPYGASKLLAEKIIKYYADWQGFRAVVFRYFNACGCGFDASVSPTHDSHLIPIVLNVARGRKPFVQIHGGDYATFDGTCIRDYVHVLDIANAHAAALAKIGEGDNFRVFNIGTGRGSSVKEIINSATEVLNRIIPMEMGPRRAGDAPATVADNTKLKQELGYDLQYSDLPTIISTAWKQINKNEG